MISSSQPTITDKNGIATRQDADHNLRKLAAQRQLYSDAKTLLQSQFLAVVFFQAVFLLSLLWPELKSSGIGMAVAYALLDLLWLTPRQKKLRSKAAAIQEAFDCDVLVLPWKSTQAGEQPRAEEIEDAYRRFVARNGSVRDLKAWYDDPRLPELSLDIARLVCQRTNAVWDSRLKHHFAGWMLGATLGICATVVLAGLLGDMSLRDFLVSAVTPLLPAILFGARQVTDSRDTATRQERLEANAARLILAASEGDTISTAQARALQDEILDIRSRNPLIFDWIYRRKRDEYASLIHAGTEDMLRRRASA